MGIFYLSFGVTGDTLPIMDAILYQPGKAPGEDPAYPNGLPVDLAGSTSWQLRIKFSSGHLFLREMTKVGPDADGHLRYAWQSTDWTAGSPMLVSGSHAMRYRVYGPGGAQATYPNQGAHSLIVDQE